MDWREFATNMALNLASAFLVIISFGVIMVGIIFHAIGINELEYRSPPAHEFSRDVIIGDTETYLLWFLQVTVSGCS